MTKKLGETSFQETAFGIIPRSKLILLEIEGIKRAWDFVLGQERKTKIFITPEFIKKLHRVGFGWIFPEPSGKFRKIEVTVSDHIPPKYYLLPQLMDSYCQDIKERLKHLSIINQPDFVKELIDLLSWAHHRFLWIHPFKDYNGRIARLLINVILFNLNLPPIELKVETKIGRRRYVAALKKADRGDDSDLAKLIQEAIEETSREVVKSKP